MRAFLSRDPLREYKNSDRVDRQDDDVQSFQIHVNPLLQQRQRAPLIFFRARPQCLNQVLRTFLELRECIRRLEQFTAKTETIGT